MLSSADATLVERDPALPGLATVLNAETLVDELQPYLPGVRLESARSTYVRYKAGINCLVAYEVKMGGATVDFYAKTHGFDAEVKSHKAYQRPFARSVLGPGRLLVADGKVVVSLFPNDSKLPVLRRLGTTEDRERTLRRIVRTHPTLWKSTVRRLRYKPERRYVGQLIAPDGSRAVAKVYTQAGYMTAHRSLRALAARGELRLAKLLGWSDRRGVVAFEWLPGRSLADVIAEGAVEHELMKRVGVALAALHAQSADELPLVTPDQRITVIRAFAAELAALCPELASLAWALVERIADLLPSSCGHAQPIHGDFSADQVLFTNDRAAIIDLDRAVLGDSRVDLGLFVAKLERAALTGALLPGQVEPITAGLLDGYCGAGQRPPVALATHTAAALFELALDPFRNREVEWPARTRAVLERVASLLEEPNRRLCGRGRMERARGTW